MAEGSLTRRPSLWIYFIRSEHSGLIKIGVSVDAEKRFGEHQAETGDRLTLLGKVPGGVQLEAAIHLAFKHCRWHPQRREWFRPEPELLLYIERRMRLTNAAAAGEDDEVSPHRRRGTAWERWEDDLLLDDHLTAKAIAARIGRTPHSISERRRWLIRHRAMLRKVME